jgi:hypothetical protein
MHWRVDDASCVSGQGVGGAACGCGVGGEQVVDAGDLEQADGLGVHAGDGQAAAFGVKATAR